jgi:hypothetical protein
MLGVNPANGEIAIFNMGTEVMIFQGYATSSRMHLWSISKLNATFIVFKDG